MADTKPVAESRSFQYYLKGLMNEEAPSEGHQQVEDPHTRFILEQRTRLNQLAGYVDLSRMMHKRILKDFTSEQWEQYKTILFQKLAEKRLTLDSGIPTSLPQDPEKPRTITDWRDVIKKIDEYFTNPPEMVDEPESQQVLETA